MNTQNPLSPQPKSIPFLTTMKQELFGENGQLQFQVDKTTYRYYSISDFENVASSVQYYGLDHLSLSERITRLYDVGEKPTPDDFVNPIGIDKTRISVFRKCPDPRDCPPPICFPCDVLPLGIVGNPLVGEWKPTAIAKVANDLNDHYKTKSFVLKRPDGFFINGELSLDESAVEFDQNLFTIEGMYDIHISLESRLDPISTLDIFHCQSFGL